MESSQKGRQGQKGQKTAPAPSSLTEGLRVWYGIWNSPVSIPSFFSIINALGFSGFVNLVKSFQWKVAKAKKKKKKSWTEPSTSDYNLQPEVQAYYFFLVQMRTSKFSCSHLNQKKWKKLFFDFSKNGSKQRYEGTLLY
jgi:hypothetical protein